MPDYKRAASQGMADGKDRNSRTRILLDGLEIALANPDDDAFAAWLKLSLRWGFVPNYSELRK